MLPTVLEARVKNLIQTEAEWLIQDPVILDGEIAYVRFGNFVNTKAGNGTKKFSQLDYNLEKPAQPTGVLKPTDNPGAPNGPRFWFAEKAVYPHIGLEITGDAGIIVDNGESYSAANFNVNLINYETKQEIREKLSSGFIKLNQGSIDFKESKCFLEDTWTIEMFIKITDAVSTQSLIYNGEGNPGILINANRISIAKADIISAGYVDISSSWVGKLIFISVSFDGEDHLVMVDGIPQTFNKLNSLEYDKKFNTLKIGAYADNTLFFTGDIALFRIFNVDLSEEESVKNFNQGLPHLFTVNKGVDLAIELLPENLSPIQWEDSSLNRSIGSLNGYFLASANKPIPSRALSTIAGVKLKDGGFVNVEPKAYFPNGNEWSIELNLKLLNITNGQTIINCGESNPLLYLEDGQVKLTKNQIALAIEFEVSQFLNLEKFLTITYKDNLFKVYVNGLVVPHTPLSTPNFNGGISPIIIGSYNGIDQNADVEVYLFRIHNRALTEKEVKTYYNNGFPSELKVLKDASLKLELIGSNASVSSWLDSSTTMSKGIMSNGAKSLSNAVPTSLTQTVYDFLSIVPTDIYIATFCEMNIWFDSIIPSYGKQYRINVAAPKGESRERCYRYQPAIPEDFNITIQVQDLLANVLESKVVTIHAVDKSAGSGIIQIKCTGDSNIDSLNAVDFPALPDGRDRYEMMKELNRLLTVSGGFTPLFLGARGTAPYNHQAHSGYSSELFITNNPTYPNPFWDLTNSRVDMRKWMADNSNFGGSDRIDIDFYQIGINDLKWNQKPAQEVLDNIKTYVANMHHATRGYPDCKIIISLSQFTGLTAEGFALHFGAASDFNLFGKNMHLLHKLIVSTFHNNPAYPNCYVSANMLFVDRKYGYPFDSVNVSARSTVQEMEYIESVHPNQSGYHQGSDATFSRIKSLV